MSHNHSLVPTLVTPRHSGRFGDFPQFPVAYTYEELKAAFVAADARVG